jgi:hypothetical protein
MYCNSNFESFVVTILYTLFLVHGHIGALLLYPSSIPLANILLSISIQNSERSEVFVNPDRILILSRSTKYKNIFMIKINKAPIENT